MMLNAEISAAQTINPNRFVATGSRQEQTVVADDERLLSACECFWGRPSSWPDEQIGCLDAQRLGKSVDYIDRSTIDTALDRTEVGPVNLSPMGKLLLRQPGGLSVLSYILGEHIPDRHARDRTAL